LAAGPGRYVLRDANLRVGSGFQKPLAAAAVGGTTL